MDFCSYVIKILLLLINSYNHIGIKHVFVICGVVTGY